MASLKDATRLTKGIEDLLGDLRTELEDGEVDFDRLASLSDEISERADGLAETFSNVNDALMQRLQQVKSNGSSASAGRSGQSSAKIRGRQSRGSRLSGSLFIGHFIFSCAIDPSSCFLLKVHAKVKAEPSGERTYMASRGTRKSWAVFRAGTPSTDRSRCLSVSLSPA